MQSFVQDVYLDTSKYTGPMSQFDSPAAPQTDARVNAILQAAEQEFYKEKQRAFEAESYIRRKNQMME